MLCDEGVVDICSARALSWASISLSHHSQFTMGILNIAKGISNVLQASYHHCNGIPCYEPPVRI